MVKIRFGLCPNHTVIELTPSKPNPINTAHTLTLFLVGWAHNQEIFVWEVARAQVLAKVHGWTPSQDIKVNLTMPYR